MKFYVAAKRMARRFLENHRTITDLMPKAVRQRFHTPLPGQVRFGDLRRLDPIDPAVGASRGLIVDRYCIDNFLEVNKHDIRGRVLEIGVDIYTRRFGGDRVEQIDVLHYVEGNPDATIVADLADGANIESDLFDCIILTQTLHLIYDFPKAIATVYRILKPGGVVLMTSPGTSKIARHLDEDDWAQYWKFTQISARLAFEEAFGPGNVESVAFGNLLTAICMLHGISADELSQAELDHRDKHYEVVVTVRAVKGSNPSQL